MTIQRDIIFDEDYGIESIIDGVQIPEQPYELHEGRFNYEKSKKLSIYVDESGNTGGAVNTNSLWYIICLVFFENQNISECEDELEYGFAMLGHPNHCFHTSPLIHGESYYANDPIAVRRKIMGKFMSFLRHIPAKHIEFSIEKKNMTEEKIHDFLIKQVCEFIENNLLYFSAFDNITFYYDNGQNIVLKVLEETVRTLIPECTIEYETPKHSRLLQIADLICSLKWLSIKSRTVGLTYKEECFFKDDRHLRKDFLRIVDMKEFKQN